MKTTKIRLYALLCVCVCFVSFGHLLTPPRLSAATQPSATRSTTFPDAGANTLGMVFARIAPGAFKMGSSSTENGHRKNEDLHNVKLTKLFYMGKYDVTVAQFAIFVDKSGYKTRAERIGARHSWRSPGFAQEPDHPVVCVSWSDATAFCEWLSKEEKRQYRLPTEAEWEYSCRAGTNTEYNIGNGKEALDAAAWHDDKQTHPVGQKKPNAWDLYDMHGNVVQWCSDWFGDYPHQDVTDPAGPEMGEQRVLRGSSFVDSQDMCRSAARHRAHQDTFQGDVGFRVVLN